MSLEILSTLPQVHTVIKEQSQDCSLDLFDSCQHSFNKLANKYKEMNQHIFQEYQRPRSCRIYCAYIKNEILRTFKTEARQ